MSERLDAFVRSGETSAEAIVDATGFLDGDPAGVMRMTRPPTFVPPVAPSASAVVTARRRRRAAETRGANIETLSSGTSIRKSGASDLAAPDAQFALKTRRMQGRAQDHWMLTLENDGGNCREVRARFMVDATGRRSSFASTQGARHIVYDQLAGVFVFFRFPSVDSVPDTYTSVEACEDGWWYTAMLPDGHMVVAFMTDADVLRKLPWQTLEEWLALPGPASHTRGRFKGGTPVAGPALYSASSQRRPSKRAMAVTL